MGTAAESLKAYIDSPDCYTTPHAQVAGLQIEAANELFRERRSAIKYLDHRAGEGGIDEIRDLSDLVGLLFAHTTYKSYPESWLAGEKWPQLSKWVDTMSTHRVQNVNFEAIKDIDDWIGRMAEAGHFLSCTSGTTGKSAMLNSSAADLAWARKNHVASVSWGAHVTPGERKYITFGLAAVASTPRNEVTREAMSEAFCRDDVESFRYPVPPITVGAITGMVVLRKRIADGIARPEEIAEYEKTSAERAAAVEGAIGITAQALIDHREYPLLISGMWGTMFKVVEEVRARGYGAKDFHPDNMFFSAGGLKGAVLPPNYREITFDTFNINPLRVSQNYSMQEIASAMPRCPAGRYHLPPWVICLLLDSTGDNLIPVQAGMGEVEGRAGFFDCAIDGRWNGVISGDKIFITYDTCECGSPSPSIRDEITRYADLEGGDKITCAGTVDAYVRGLT